MIIFNSTIEASTNLIDYRLTTIVKQSSTATSATTNVKRWQKLYITLC